MKKYFPTESFLRVLNRQKACFQKINESGAKLLNYQNIVKQNNLDIVERNGRNIVKQNNWDIVERNDRNIVEQNDRNIVEQNDRNIVGAKRSEYC